MVETIKIQNYIPNPYRGAAYGRENVIKTFYVHINIDTNIHKHMIKRADRYLHFFRHLKYETSNGNLYELGIKKREEEEEEKKIKIPRFLNPKQLDNGSIQSSKIQRIRTITGKIFRAIKQGTRKRLARLHCLKHNRASSRVFHADLTNVNVEV